LWYIEGLEAIVIEVISLTAGEMVPVSYKSNGKVKEFEYNFHII
jgi:hypothetical protein